jgi:hypothetical protein
MAGRRKAVGIGIYNGRKGRLKRWTTVEKYNS